MSVSPISLTNTLDTFERALNFGRVGLAGYAVNLTILLATLEAAFGGLYLALGWKNYADVAKRVLTVGIILWIVQNYHQFIKATLDGFVWVGETATEGPAALTGLRDPDAIVSVAYNMFYNGFQALAEQSYFSLDIILALSCIVGLIAMFIIALQVFVTYLEFMLVSTAGVILIPFSVFRPMAFIAERIFGAIISYGIKLMVLSLLVGVTLSVAEGKAIPPEPNWKDCFDMVLFTLSLAFLSWQAPSAIQALLTGNPQLGGSDAVYTAKAGASHFGSDGIVGKPIRAVAKPVMGGALGVAKTSLSAVYGGLRSGVGGKEGGSNKNGANENKAGANGKQAETADNSNSPKSPFWERMKNEA